MSFKPQPALLLAAVLALHVLAAVADAISPESPVLETVVAIELVFLAAWLQGGATRQ